jgi:hypothetical protein
MLKAAASWRLVESFHPSGSERDSKIRGIACPLHYVILFDEDQRMRASRRFKRGRAAAGATRRPAKKDS